MYSISDDVFCIDIKDTKRKLSYASGKESYGTTYNSYLIKSDKNILIDGAPGKFSDEYFSELEKIISPKEIDYVIFNHTEPDNSGMLLKLLNVNPDIQVISTIAGLKNLKEITNCEFNEYLAKDSAILNFNQFSLQFFTMPNLHWPDTMITYCPKKQLLFSGDFLGAHFISDNNTYCSEYDSLFEEYYLSLMSPYKAFVLSACNKISGLDIKTILPAHGSVLFENYKDALAKYTKWSTPCKQELKQIVILYKSEYGYTKELAIAASEQANECGCDTKILSLDNISENSIGEVIKNADGIMIGTPTISRNVPPQVWNIIKHIDVPSCLDKEFAVFGSYGWSGEATLIIQSVLKTMKLRVKNDVFRISFCPNSSDIEKMKLYTKKFIEELKDE